MERKSFPFEMEEKGLDPEARTFQGFAAVMGNLDEGGDVIVNGAFKKTIKEMGRRVKVYYIHDFTEPIGKILELKEVPRSRLPSGITDRAADATGGLFVKGYISETRAGNDAMTLMRDSVLDELSIGFKSIKDELEELDDGGTIRHIKEIKLMDISPVPLAMNPAAIVTDVKGVKVEETEDYIRVPVPGESGKHEEHRIRTITISEEKGIKALYCGECEKNILYMFAKEKGWTVAKAVAWVKEHEKARESDDAHKQLAAVETVAIKAVDEYFTTGVVSHDTCNEFKSIVIELLSDWERASTNTDAYAEKATLKALIQQANIQGQGIEAALKQ